MSSMKTTYDLIPSLVFFVFRGDLKTRFQFSKGVLTQNMISDSGTTNSNKMKTTYDLNPLLVVLCSAGFEETRFPFSRGVLTRKRSQTLETQLSIFTYPCGSS